MTHAIHGDAVAAYRAGTDQRPARYRLWPLYGAGFDHLGLEGETIERATPQPGPDELLVRHDAVGICFSDVKVIRAGQSHPRIYRDMSRDPVVLGHEVSLTVVAVGEKLRDAYHIGDRFIVQADIYIGGVGYAYGYELQGGFSQYNIVDQRVLNGDGGNYLLPIRATTGYAEAALNEPWACVEASYHVEYRTRWKEGGALLIAGGGESVELGAAAEWRPGRVVLETADGALREQFQAWAEETGIPVAEADAAQQFDDIVVVGSDAATIEAAFARLAKGGMLNVVTAQEVGQAVPLDVGRLHYDNLALVGTPGPDLSAAYSPIRAELKAGGALWVLGAGGPMGQMHLQRAFEIAGRPRKVIGTNRNIARLEAVARMLRQQARHAGIEFVTLSQESFGTDLEAEQALLKRLRAESGGPGGRPGFDDIAVMAPSASAIEGAVGLLADGGVMNIFAGLPRGTLAALDVDAVVRRGVRFTGMSGSSIGDLRMVRDLMESGRLAPGRSVVAVAGLEGVPEGLAGVAEGRFAGKVVIFPNLSKLLPLTTLEELRERLPSVHALLGDGGIWSVAAEEELLRLLL